MEQIDLMHQIDLKDLGEHIATNAEALSRELGVKIRLIRDTMEIEERNKRLLERKRRTKGWYDAKDLSSV